MKALVAEPGAPSPLATPPATAPPLATALVGPLSTVSLTSVTIATLQAEPAPVLDCGVFLSAYRHDARAVVVFDAGALQVALRAPSSGGVWQPSLARLLRYYRSVPRKAATKNGIVFLLCGSPATMRSAFDLISNTLQIQSRQVNIYIYFFTYIYIYIYICVCVCVCVCISRKR